MSGHNAPGPRLPIVDFIDAMSRKRDTPAVFIVTTIVLLTSVLLLLPVSATVRTAAARRFQLAGWPFAAWALLQPLPSMYNFENQWKITFTPPAGAVNETCGEESEGFVNHHVLDTVFLGRVALERCGLPAYVRFRTTYRGTTVETGYLLAASPGSHGFTITPQPER